MWSIFSVNPKRTVRARFSKNRRQKKLHAPAGSFDYNEGLVRDNYFLLNWDAAAGDEPDTNTANTDLNKSKMFREGL
jgi:hypothetical protein